MPEYDFELYLALLSRFLRLQPAQRQEIADELRDHLEERLEELSARGLSRDEAIRAALDEFGDAAELANHFTQVSRTRKRRLIMRFTFGTAAALAAALLVATAFWPEARHAAAPGQAIAQLAGGSESRKGGGTAVAVEEDGKHAIESKLNKRLGKLEFEDVPLADVIEQLGDQMEVDILFDGTALSEEGIATDVPVGLKVKRANLTARVALDLVLEPFRLSYTIRDGVIMVTTTSQANQIQVYNVRDLLHAGDAVPGMQVGSIRRAAGGGFFQIAPPEAAPGAKMGDPGLGGQPMGGQGMGPGAVGALRATSSLAELIAETIDPESWAPEGNGSIVQYHELLVVKNSQAVHSKIKALLEMMRTSAREPGAAPAGRPAGGAGAGPAVTAG